MRPFLFDSRSEGQSGVGVAGLGAFVAARRAALGLSLAEAAERTGVHASSLSRIERGQQALSPDSALLGQLAAALDFDTTEKQEFVDLAHIASARLPQDLLAHPTVASLLSHVLAAIRDPHVVHAIEALAQVSSREPEASHALIDVLSKVLHAQVEDVAPGVLSAGSGAVGGSVPDVGTRTSSAGGGLVEQADDLHLGSAAKRASVHVASSRATGSAMTTSARANVGAEQVAKASYRNGATRVLADAQLLQEHFDALLARNPEFGAFIHALHEHDARVVVFGGWARDHIAARAMARAIEPKDVDLVVDNVSVDTLEAIAHRAAPKASIERNAFDGLRMSFDGLPVDAWPLAKTYTFVARGMVPAFESLPATTVFTIESVIFKPRQSWPEPLVLEAGFYDALDERVLELQDGERPFPEFQVGRALQLAQRLELVLSPRLMAFIDDVLATAGGVAAVQRGIRQFGHPDWRGLTLRRLRLLRTALRRAEVTSGSYAASGGSW